MDIKQIARVALSLWLLTSTVAVANTDNSGEHPPMTSADSGGSRGCNTEVDSPKAITLLTPAPTQTWVKTISTRPTFAWFVREPQTRQMEFRLYQYDSVSKKEKLITTIDDENFKSSPGIMVLSLSDSLPALSIGQRYVWQVILKCTPGQPGSYVDADAAFQVVEIEPDLKIELAKTNDEFNRAVLYEQANFWYDAVGVALMAQDAPRLRELKLSLLDRVPISRQERESPIHRVQR